ncbi:DUF2064 domain-containing protein [Nitrosomonas halophila]|uniref:DUF2064 domain-containing protein n=1 Tax=Nitrosomonas halophila TaxID=44576 RepID=A0A1H3P251_9PROT|nr:DUF2064 domain-containing protein [Nitrosomonas halophila]SDY94499.1 hypothetical protein SAMN05421881_10856 [Nitrosomonas halophila]
MKIREMAKMDAVLVVVCKRPRPGMGKQRLAVGFGIEQAMACAQALLDCALEDALAWRGPVVIAPASSGDRAWAASLLPPQSMVTIQPQGTGNLGQRLNGLDRSLRLHGAKRLIYIGSDAPLLTEEDYSACRVALMHADTVLIPAVDGGVVMMASNLPWPELGHLPWSTAHLGAALMEQCRQAGQTVVCLKPNVDIDEPEQIEQLCADLRHDARPARRRLHALVSCLHANKRVSHA